MVSLLMASLLWAFSFGLIKGELSGLSPVAVAAGRLSLAALVFLPLWGRQVTDGRTRLLAAGLGALQFGLMYVLYIASFQWLPAWLVALFTIFTPLYVVLLADFRRSSLRIRSLGAALLAIAGAAVVTARGMPAGGAWTGVLLLQGANLCFAAGQLGFGILKRRSGASDAPLLAWMYGGAAAVTLAALPVAAAGGPGLMAGWDLRAFSVLLYLGLLPTALGFYLWNRGAARTAPAVLAVANNLKVPLAVVVSWLVFGETAAYGPVLAGMGLMVVALMVAAGSGSRRQA